MSQDEFLIRRKGYGGKYRIRQTETFNALYEEECKPGKNLGPFPVSVGTGRFNKNKIILLFHGDGATIPATAEGVKQAIRRLRPQEGDSLDQIDAAIAELQAERRALLGKAWTNAHVVTLAEVKAKADEVQAKR